MTWFYYYFIILRPNSIVYLYSGTLGLRDFFYKTVTVWRKNYLVSVCCSTIFVKLEVLCDLIKQLLGVWLHG